MLFKRANIAWKVGAGTIVATFLLSLLVVDLLKVKESDATIVGLPKPTEILELSKMYSAPTLKALKIDPENPLNIDFVIDTKDQGDVSPEEAAKLIRYFLTGLTVPEDDLWVNLSPYEQNRIINDSLSVTDAGRDMLAQDYVLKQLISSLTYPESDTGKDYWDTTYEKLMAVAKTINVPVNTFNKVWIVPEIAMVYENNNMAVIKDSSLDVMLEEDYMAKEQNAALLNNGDVQTEEINKVSSDVMKDVVLPKIKDDVNFGQNFSQLRQLHSSLILAKWFKTKFIDSFYGDYINKGKVAGVDNISKEDKQKLYDIYVEAFKKGCYDYIKKEYDPGSKQNIQKRYFSGGVAKLQNNVQSSAVSDFKYSEALAETQSSTVVSIEVAAQTQKQSPVEELLARAQQAHDNENLDPFNGQYSAERSADNVVEQFAPVKLDFFDTKRGFAKKAISGLVMNIGNNSEQAFNDAVARAAGKLNVGVSEMRDAVIGQLEMLAVASSSVDVLNEYGYDSDMQDFIFNNSPLLELHTILFDQNLDGMFNEQEMQEYQGIMRNFADVLKRSNGSLKVSANVVELFNDIVNNNLEEMFPWHAVKHALHHLQGVSILESVLGSQGFDQATIDQSVLVYVESALGHDTGYYAGLDVTLKNGGDIHLAKTNVRHEARSIESLVESTVGENRSALTVSRAVVMAATKMGYFNSGTMSEKLDLGLAEFKNYLNESYFKDLNIKASVSEKLTAAVNSMTDSDIDFLKSTLIASQVIGFLDVRDVSANTAERIVSLYGDRDNSGEFRDEFDEYTDAFLGEDASFVKDAVYSVKTDSAEDTEKFNEAVDKLKSAIESQVTDPILAAEISGRAAGIAGLLNGNDDPVSKFMKTQGFYNFLASDQMTPQIVNNYPEAFNGVATKFKAAQTSIANQIEEMQTATVQSSSVAELIDKMRGPVMVALMSVMFVAQTAFGGVKESMDRAVVDLQELSQSKEVTKAEISDAVSMTRTFYGHIGDRQDKENMTKEVMKTIEAEMMEEDGVSEMEQQFIQTMLFASWKYVAAADQKTYTDLAMSGVSVIFNGAKEAIVLYNNGQSKADHFMNMLTFNLNAKLLKNIILLYGNEDAKANYDEMINGFKEECEKLNVNEQQINRYLLKHKFEKDTAQLGINNGGIDMNKINVDVMEGASGIQLRAIELGDFEGFNFQITKLEKFDQSDAMLASFL